eukprot:COSAG06_NODE_2294_length_7143_cov_5.506388_3_plen_107_part_00
MAVRGEGDEVAANTRGPFRASTLAAAATAHYSAPHGRRLGATPKPRHAKQSWRLALTRRPPAAPPDFRAVGGDPRVEWRLTFALLSTGSCCLLSHQLSTAKQQRNA